MIYNYREYDQYGEEKPTDRGVNGVTLSVYKGEFLALVGRNGSGKSTLAKMFNGLLLAQKGKVDVYGLNPAIEKELYQIRAKVGMVFQNPDNQTVASIVEDDVAFGPENLGVSQKELRERVDTALADVNMSKYATKTTSRLSGGQKQRVAIAGALALRPKILVLDEATSMLDPEGRRDVMDTVSKLNDAGMTVVAITHFMDEAACADRIVALKNGKIALEGTPAEVFAQHDKLEQLGLKTPRDVELALRLKESGLDIEPQEDIFKLGEALCQLLSKT